MLYFQSQPTFPVYYTNLIKKQTTMCASELIFSVVDIKKLDNGWQILYSLIYLKKKKKKRFSMS